MVRRLKGWMTASPMGRYSRKATKKKPVNTACTVNVRLKRVTARLSSSAVGMTPLSAPLQFSGHLALLKMRKLTNVCMFHSHTVNSRISQ